MTQHQLLRLIVLMPLRDDWASASELIRQLDKAVSSEDFTMEILLVDDGSMQRFDRSNFQSGYSVVRAIRILRLRRNLGHQRAIAIGLAHVQNTASCDAVVVMDADGEDTPEGVAQLLRAYSDIHGSKPFLQDGAAGRNLLSFDFFIIFTKSCIWA